MRPSLLAALVLTALAVACSSSGGSSDTTGVDALAPDTVTTTDTPADAPRPDGITPDVDDATPAACTDGATSCDETRLWQLACIAGVWQQVKACEAGTLCLGGSCVPSEACTPGEAGPCAAITTATTCDPSGLGFARVDCVVGEVCVGLAGRSLGEGGGACKVTACIPDAPVCADPTHAATCLPDGSGPGPAIACDDIELCLGGTCRFVCGDGLKYAGSSIGCRFWSVDLGQWNPKGGLPALDAPAAGIPHAVIIANPNDVNAVISFRTGDDSAVEVDNPIVAPGETRSFEMPVMSLQEAGVTRKSIRVLSTQPVVAAQFNPPSNKDLVHTSDASLLYPQESLGTKHVVVSMGSLAGGSMNAAVFGYVTVVAVSSGATEVTFTPACPTEAGPLFDEVAAGQAATVTLQQWDVLTVQGKGASAMDFNVKPSDNDLTGTVVEATQPVAVFGGHDCVNVGAGNCDHLETQLLPVEAWGTEYVAGHMEIQSPNVYRVTAYYDGTMLTTAPVVSGLEGHTLNRGEWVEASSSSDFVISSDKPFQVVSFIAGYDPGSGSGSGILIDPSMAALIPTHQYRQDYPLLVPDDYEADYVTIIRPKGSALLLDYNPLSDGAFKTIGVSAWEVGNLQLAAGMHRIEGSKPFGAVAWGAGNKVSYAYPAGANIQLQATGP